VIENPAGSGGFMTDQSSGMMPLAPPVDSSTLPPPDPNAPPPPPPAPGAIVRGGPGTRGFVITLKCTSPDAGAVQLVFNQMLTNLMAIWPTADRPRMEYGVAKAAMISAKRIGEDPQRLQQLTAQYNSAVQAQRIADQAAQLAKSAAEAAMAQANPGAGQPRVGMFGGPGAQPPLQGGAVAAVVPDPNDAYKDRLTGEDMRKDWEFTVLFAVQLDPPPPPAPAAGAPAVAGAPGTPAAVPATPPAAAP
jgi:hypothetical protein